MGPIGFRLGTLGFVALFAVPASAQLVPIDGRSPIPVRSQRVEAEVIDGLARTRVRQVFVNPYDAPLEALYLLRIPERASLVELVLEVGGERLQGRLGERREARRTYDELVRSKRDPALVEQVGAGCFRLSVFPVLPGVETAVELAWIEEVPLAGGAYRYVCPLASSDASPRDQLVTVRVRSALELARVDASLAGAEVVRPSANEALVTLETSGRPATEDLVVTATLAPTPARIDLSTFRDGSGGGWFLALVTPPSAGEAQLVPRDLVLVLDTSGSMQAEHKLERARAAALWMLDHLRAEDRVQIVRFSSEVERSSEAPLEATPENLERLRSFVRGLEAKGGTALGDALRAATDGAPEEGRARSVVLVTDGRPTVGETQVTQLVELAASAGRAGARIHAFGVGEDVDAGLLRGIAAAGRGRAELFRPGGEIESRLVAFLARSASPVWTGLSIELGGANAFDVLPRPLPDLFLGEQLAISGRYREGGSGFIHLTARGAAGPVGLDLDTRFPSAAGGDRSVLEHHARQKLAFLEDALRLREGLPDDAYYAALDRGAYSTAEELVQEMVATSLESGVQCAYTSFLALLPEERARLASGSDGPRASVLGDAEIVDHGEVDADAMDPSGEGDPDFLSDSPFDEHAFNDVIGVGGDSGGAFGGRSADRHGARSAEELAAQSRVLEQLVGLQSEDGSWSGAVDDTGLALYALLASGHTSRTGLHRERVCAGLNWLRDRQRFEDGGFGDASDAPDLRAHALATLALAEAYSRSRSPILCGPLTRALAFGEASVDAQDAEAGAWWMLATDTASHAGLRTQVASALRVAIARIEGRANGASLRALALRCIARSFAAGATPDEALERALIDALAAATELDPETAYWAGGAAHGCGWRALEAWREALRGALLAESDPASALELDALAYRALCLTIEVP